MKLGGMRDHRVVHAAALVGAVTLSAPSCTQDGTGLDRAEKLARDPVERMITEAERRQAVARELAGRPAAQPDGETRDAAISARAMARLSAERSLRAAHIQVRTQGRIVTLDGVTDTPQSREKAAQLVMNVQGVRSVKNEIRVDDGS